MISYNKDTYFIYPDHAGSIYTGRSLHQLSEIVVET